MMADRIMPPTYSAGNTTTGRKQATRPSRTFFLMCLLTHVLTALLAFNMGYVYASHQRLTDGPQQYTISAESYQEGLPFVSPAAVVSSRFTTVDNSQHVKTLLPLDTVGLFAAGIARAKRDDFTNMIDLGLPLDDKQAGNEEVLVVYSNYRALPKAKPLGRMMNDPTNSVVPLYSAKDATANCHTIRLVLQQPKKDKECMVILGQWESFNINKYMRIPPSGRGQANFSIPFRHVARGQRVDGKVAKMPMPRQTKAYWKVLMDYLNKLDQTVARLKPIAQLAAGKGNAVIVMTCNWGQADLLANFICGARSRGLDLSQVLLFATDEDTHNLAVALGIHSFFVEDAFGEMPKAAARVYGDKKFAGMMMAKVYCVHLLNVMGYDVLFQDVDMYWYKNPLDYFKSKEAETAETFDMYFQDDGARSVRYAPYSPNSGFYFVRGNQRTQYFFSVFLRMGDLIQSSGSHQSALTSLLVEHANWKGLLIKVFGMYQAEGDLFPGGYHFHRKKEYMQQLLRGEREPYIFHMSWTRNKDNKQLFMEQVGHWHLQKQCENKRVEEIGGKPEDLVNLCCSAEPIVSCHYRDKPSKIPCKDSPPIDKGKPSFW